MEVKTDTVDLHGGRHKKRSRKFWKGDTIHGWQICMAPERVGSNLGQVMPIIIDYPVSGQFTAMVTVRHEEDGEIVETQMPQWQYKGFKPVSELNLDTLKPSQQIIDALLERACKEIEINGKEDKLKPEDVRAEQDALRVMVYRANGLGDPEEDARELIKRERAEARNKRRPGRPRKQADE